MQHGQHLTHSLSLAHNFKFVSTFMFPETTKLLKPLFSYPNPNNNQALEILLIHISITCGDSLLYASHTA